MIIGKLIVAASVSALGCVPSPHLTATQVTCNAFAAYQSHPTKGNLVQVVKDSFAVPGYGKPGLVSDIAQLWADSSGGDQTVLPADIEWARDDCEGAN
jgi:hypothetical protein